VACNVLYLDSDDIAAAKLAVDGQIKKGEIAYSPLSSNRVLIDQTCFGRSGSLGPVSLPLIARRSFVSRYALLRLTSSRSQPAARRSFPCVLHLSSACECMNSEINEGADFRRPMLAGGIEGIERKQFARPVWKQFD
jgi:hypothetical protein